MFPIARAFTTFALSGAAARLVTGAIAGRAVTPVIATPGRPVKPPPAGVALDITIGAAPGAPLARLAAIGIAAEPGIVFIPGRAVTVPAPAGIPRVATVPRLMRVRGAAVWVGTTPAVGIKVSRAIAARF